MYLGNYGLISQTFWLDVFDSNVTNLLTDVNSGIMLDQNVMLSWYRCWLIGLVVSANINFVCHLKLTCCEGLSL